ncbi:MAG: glnS [Acidobacteria bacterium]|nr:glnS [Acidobacteriota bacterium]
MTDADPTRPTPDSVASPEPKDFIRQVIEADREAGRHGGRLHTRFPPEPNGYLHIGHAKAICLNFGVAEEYGGQCNLRFDDTNPEKEEEEYVRSIEEDVRWLGWTWDGLYFASDYFEQMYQYAEQLIRAGKAYVDDLSADEIREHRGTLTEPGRESPYRNRSIEESLDLFRRMRAGEFPDGSRVLRAKIDMASPNINMRDPVIYRVRHASHHRTGDAWCVYPMYTYAHPLEDAIEGITHSLCTLEFEDQRPFYDWVVNTLDTPYKPQQIEFARLNLNYTVMSKRKLLRLVQEGHVRGWDDPRMPTIAGLRRRGYTPESIRDFAGRIGIAKAENTVDVALLEHCVREDLNKRAPRAMAVLRPLKVVIENYPEGQVEQVEAVNNPEDASAGTRTVPFSRELYIEQDDFREVPPPKYHRLSPGVEVRLRYAYIIKCVGVVKDPGTGERTTQPRCRAKGSSRADASRAPSTGSRHRMRPTPRCASTIGSSRPTIPRMCPKARTSGRPLTRTRSTSCATRSWNRRSPRPRPAIASSSSASATSAWIPTALPALPSGTASSACVTRGRRSRRGTGRGAP